MPSTHDANHPAPGVRVDPVPRPKIEGLTVAQQKARKRYTQGVLRQHARCSPTTLGMASTARITQRASPIVETPRRGQNRDTVRPGRRRRSPKPRTRSLCHLAGNGDLGRECEHKRQQRAEARRQRRLENLIRRAKRCIRKGHLVVLGQLIRRIGKLAPDRLDELARYQRNVQASRRGPCT